MSHKRIDAVPIQAADLSDVTAFGVQDTGDVWVAQRDASSRLLAFEKRARVEGTVTSLAVAYPRAKFVGAQALFHWNGAAVLSCEPGTPVQGAYLQRGLRNEQVLTADWEVFSFQPVDGTWSWCESQTIEHTGLALELGDARCDDSVNPRVLTSTQLIGLNDCVRIL